MKTITQKKNITQSEIAVRYIQSEVNSVVAIKSIETAFDILFEELLKTSN